MNILTIDHKTFYELQVEEFGYCGLMGATFVRFTTPNDAPAELLKIIGEAAAPQKIHVKKVFVKYIAGAFFAHQPLFVAFDDRWDDWSVNAVLPMVKPIVAPASEAEIQKLRETLFCPCLENFC